MFEKRKITHHSAGSFIDIHKELKIRYEGEYKETLFKWIIYFVEFIEEEIALFYQLKLIINRSVFRSTYLYGSRSNDSEIFIT
jgi:hypothetical protein